jgi:hypothetical protein
MISGKIGAASDSKSACIRQVLTDDGHRLPPDRHELVIVGQPRRAVPSWHRWAAVERWVP